MIRFLGPPKSFDLCVSRGDLSSSPWAATNLTPTKGVANPIDGGLDAWDFVDNSTNGLHQLAQTIPGGSLSGQNVCFSCYVKAGSKGFCALGLSGGFAYFNLSTGAIGTVASVTAITQTIGGGWFRVGVYTSVSTNGIIIYCANADGSVSYAGAGDAAIKIYKPQVVLGTAIR